MKPRALYNENDPAAAHVLRCLIADGIIAPGVVDDRSIKELTADDLRGFTQVHLFAGAGTWSVSARLAGWPDERSIWTASCPCQPYSAAGKGLGADDPRHLWPDVLRLVSGARAAGFGPSVLVGEQVSGKAGYGWFDGVRADLASEGYASRVRDFPALAVDAPHERNRLYWVAVSQALDDTTGARRNARKTGAMETLWNGTRSGKSERRDGDGRDVADGDKSLLQGQPPAGEFALTEQDARDHGEGVTLGDAFGAGLERQRGHGDGSRGSVEARSASETDGSDRGRSLASADGGGEPGRRIFGPGESDGADYQWPHSESGRPNGSFWSDYEWLICHDGKARRTKPGLQLLVDGMAGRIPAWRLAGNSIVAPAAVEVLIALREVLDMRIPA